MTYLIVSLIFSVLAFTFSVVALINTEAQRRSTHQVTFFDPAKQSFSDLGKDTVERMTKAEEELYPNIQ